MLPNGYRVLASADGVAGKPGRTFEIVALGRTDEDDGTLTVNGKAHGLSFGSGRFALLSNYLATDRREAAVPVECKTSSSPN